MRALLILNERSRFGVRDGDAVCRTLAALGIECERDAAAANVEAVIAAGGDGTVVRAVPVAMERGVPLGIVPLGTFNDLARSLGIPREIQSACGIIRSARTADIDVGRVNGVHFVNEASVGLSTRIARKQTPELKQRLGFLAVAVTTLQAIREANPFRVALQYDGVSETFRSIQLTIANNGHFGGIVDRGDARVDDGWLDLYSLEVTNWMQACALAAKVLRHDPASGKGLRTRRAQQFFVQTHHAHHIAADGEPAGFTPALFEVLPRALRIFVPLSQEYIR